MRQQHQRKPVDLVFHGDTGCYTMLMFEPTKDLMHNYSGMGLGGGTTWQQLCSSRAPAL